jgi:hypothetical protein
VRGLEKLNCFQLTNKNWQNAQKSQKRGQIEIVSEWTGEKNLKKGLAKSKKL